MTLTYETIREWTLKFGNTFAKKLKCHRPQWVINGTWTEVFIKINGKSHYLWRAVNQHGNVLDILVQKNRDKRAAKRFFRKLLKGLKCVPRVIITDKLGSYQFARGCLKSQ